MRIRFSFNRLFCLLMALYVLNFSVDPPDGHVRKTVYGEAQEDLRVNEMESIGEWVLEHILGLTNAIPEHDASDESGHIAKSFFYWVAPDQFMSFLLPPAADTIHPAVYSFCPPVLFPCYSEVTSPPPWRS